MQMFKATAHHHCRPLSAISFNSPNRRSKIAPFTERPVERRRAAGFTLLETVVALAVFAAGAMALYGLFNTNLIALGRVQVTTEQLPVARTAIEVLASVNPWHEPEGEFEIDGRQVIWSARLVQPIRHGQTNAGIMAGFDFGLYDIEFTIADKGRRLGTWRMRSVGYERVRGLPPGEDIF